MFDPTTSRTLLYVAFVILYYERLLLHTIVHLTSVAPLLVTIVIGYRNDVILQRKMESRVFHFSRIWDTANRNVSFHAFSLLNSAEKHCNTLLSDRSLYTGKEYGMQW